MLLNKKTSLFDRFNTYFDNIFSKSDYHKEINFIKSQISNKNLTKPNILDVNCAMGDIISILVNSGFLVEGIESDNKLIKIAQKKNPNIVIKNDKMNEYKALEKYDLITCLFSSINYNKNLDDLKRTITNLYVALKKYGLIIFDVSNFDKFQEESRNNHVDFYKNDDLTIARIRQWSFDNNDPNMYKANFLLLTKKGENFDFEVKQTDLTNFKIEDLISIATQIGFKVECFDDFSYKPVNENTKKAVFVCTKDEK